MQSNDIHESTIHQEYESDSMRLMNGRLHHQALHREPKLCSSVSTQTKKNAVSVRSAGPGTDMDVPEAADVTDVTRLETGSRLAICPAAARPPPLRSQTGDLPLSRNGGSGGRRRFQVGDLPSGRNISSGRRLQVGPWMSC